jgi:hypothetical protein
MPSYSQPSPQSPFVSLAPPAAEPAQLYLTTEEGPGVAPPGVAPVSGDLVGELGGMKIHLRLTGDMIVQRDAHALPDRGAPGSFGLHELEAPDVTPPAPEPWPSQAEMQGESMFDAVKGRAAERRKEIASALPRAIPDDPDWAKHVPLEYKLDAKEIVDLLLADLHAARTGDDLERAHVGVALADWGTAALEMFELSETAILFGPILAVAGLFLSLGAGYAAANEAIAIKWAGVGFSRGVVTSTKGMGAAKIMEHFGHEQFNYGWGAADNANTVAKAYHLGGLGAGFLQGRQLSANQRTVFWKDMQQLLRQADPKIGPPLSWDNWAGVFLKNHVQAD